jgi:predicted dehydrogenase/threonine dehydrogenase-like Zn-dependent dehydrogenase
MRQLVQNYKTGELRLAEVPLPVLTTGSVLVANRASVISAGTEKTKIDMGKKSLVQKALARPDLVKQVLQKVRTEGLLKTYQTVQTRLTAPSPLGYSCAGVAVEVGRNVQGIRPGDRVACGGAGYANHAEFVSVPGNLVVPVPEGVSDDEAAFATVGSIALQGVRLADPKLGERFLVIGLGLLGQLTVRLLRANGCTVLGSDLQPDVVARAEASGAIGVPPGADVVQACLDATGGHGVDGVLICAGTSSDGPIEMAGAACREKGRVVVVGAVGMNVPREPYFKKEVTVVISRSYGPGRYDPRYEEGGQDYPIGYVRFTEQRNLSAFLELIGSGRLAVDDLITHRFAFDAAIEAYGLIEGERREPYLGIVLGYPPVEGVQVASLPAEPSPHAAVDGVLRLASIGAGNYATATLLPLWKKQPGVQFAGLMTASGRTAEGVQAQFGFAHCAGTPAEVLGDDADATLILTRHGSHAALALAALEAGKHVIAEKPLCLTEDELDRIVAARGDRQVLVGFNRRFAPATAAVIDHLAGAVGPRMVAIRVNAGAIPADHWIQDPQEGGGRMIGEACHFVDLAAALVGSPPVRVAARGTGRADKSALLNDNVAVTLDFEDGSVATILYTSEGSKAQPKERVEVFAGGLSAVVDDFRSATLFSGSTGKKTVASGGQDKGQAAMVAAMAAGLTCGEPAIDFATTEAVSRATLRVVDSLACGHSLAVYEA